MIDQISQLWRRLNHYWRRENLGRELEEEMRFHLEMKAKENIENGMKSEDAQREAQRQFGNRTRFRETSREIWRFMSIDTLFLDFRYGLRMLLKRPGFTLIALASLTFGIGANTAIFSLFNAAILRPLPIERPGELVGLNNTAKNRMFATLSYPNYKDLRDRNEVFAGLVAYSYAPLNLSHDGVNERLWGYLVTGNYFETLGVKAVLGRAISTEDDRLTGAHPVAVISYDCWQKRFGGQPNAIGKTVRVNGGEYTIIGVAPAGFYGTEIISAPEMWFPVAMQPQIEVGRNWLEVRGDEPLFVQARMKSGVSLSQAQAAVSLLASQLEREYPTVNEGKKIILNPPGLLGGVMRGPFLGFTALLMIVVGLVLLLACTNLVNLLLARATERRREIAVRLALGAGRFRVVRQLLAESLTLSIGGGVFGLVFAFWLVRIAASVKPPVDLPLVFELHVDSRVFIFTVIISLLTGLLFGLLPALQATKTDLIPALKDESAFSGYRRSWMKDALIVLQIALSLVLLISGGLMLRGLQRAQTLQLGFNPENAIEVSFDLRLQGYNSAQGRELQKDLLGRVRSSPGVKYAGIADMIPVDLHMSRTSVFIEGAELQRGATAPRTLTNVVSPGYFQAMSTRLVKGRDFTEQDDETAIRAAIVNETFAKTFWPGEEALGKRLSLGKSDSVKLEVIGVTEDGKYTGLNEDPRPFVYRSIFQSYSGTTSLIVRTEYDSNKMLSAIRSEAQQVDSNMPLTNARTLNDRMSLPLLPARLAASVFGGFGLLALMLAAIGIYGVMFYSVLRRTHEIGVRMALGAQKSDIMKLVMGQGTVLLLIGIGVGLAAAVALTSFMKSLLYGISATDPMTFTVITALLALAALLASYLPARRAIKVDPVIALRCE